MTKAEAEAKLVAALTEDELKLCRLSGITPEAFIQQRMSELLGTDPHRAR